MHFRTLIAFMALPAALAAQGSATPHVRPNGRFLDDYGSRHTITDSSWTHHPASTYLIIRADSAGQFLVARNAASNPGQPGRYTRIDWLRLDSLPPWEWAFCLSAWDAPTADSAAATLIARRDQPRTGCNGFPFTRLRRADGSEGNPGP